MHFADFNNLSEGLCPALVQDIICEVVKRRKVLG